MMKNISLVAFMLLSWMSLYGQQKAVTDKGETVVLYSDGRWTYITRDSIKKEEIPVNPDRFVKPTNASFLLKSDRVGVGCWLDPKKWTFLKAAEHDAAEYEINNEAKGLYGIIITENLRLSVEALANIAIDNARAVAPDVKITQKEYRNVNGLNVLMMRMTGTIQDILFSYYGYYYTDDSASVQYLVYSSEENIESNLGDIEDLLNGFVSLKNE
jgi:hypothetical protein